MKDIVFYGVHIPKTAGASFLKHFKENIDPENFYQNTALIDVFNKNELLLEEYSDFSKLKVVFGHHVSEKTINMVGRAPYLFTFLRDPYKRLLSNYTFNNRLRKKQGWEGISFERYIESIESDFICNWLINRFPSLVKSHNSLVDSAWSVLLHFDFVTSPEYFSKDIPELFDIMNIKDHVVKRENISSEAEYLEINLEENIAEIKEKICNDNVLFDRYLEVKNTAGWKKTNNFNCKRKPNSKDIALAESVGFAVSECEAYSVLEREAKVSFDKSVSAVTKYMAFNGSRVDEEFISGIRNALLNLTNKNFK